MTHVPQKRFQIVGIPVAFILWLAGTAFQADAQPPQRAAPARQFHENATLPVEGNLRKRFLTAEELLSDARWTEAITILQEIAQSDHKGLVQVQQGKPGGYQTYLNVATRCNVLMSRITADGLKSYRQKVDPQAKRWFESWQRTRDETELLRIVRIAFLSSYGDDALLALGETAWDQGDLSAARLWWEQIVPLPDEAKPGDYPTVLRYPDSNIDQPTLIARIVLCSILDREHVRAEDELRRFSLKFPSAEGWIAGQQGSLVDILKRELERSRQWPVAGDTADVETFGLSASRFRMLPETIDVGALRWSRPLTPNLLPHPVEGFPFQNPPFSYHPVVHDGVAFVNDSESIRAWNVWTGEPAWQSDQVDPATVYPTNNEQQSIIPDKMCVGVPEYTMTIAENRLYARMGSAVTCLSNLPQKDLESDLVCLDLAQQGKLLWSLPARNVMNDGSWRYEGTPVVRAGRAFVAMCRRRPQLELMIVCLDAVDGRLLWQRSIGGFKTSVDDSQNRVSHLLLTLGGGRVFLNTDAGAVVALDAVDGRFEWAVTYESRTDETPASLSDPALRGLLPAMFHRGWLVAAPNDADCAFCIEADSGRVRWQFPYVSNTAHDIPDLLKRELHAAQRRDNQWRQLLGVVPGGSSGRLIVSGKSLTAVDLDTGNRIWQTPRSTFGRGLLADDQIYLPGRTSIEICSQQTGQLLRTVTLKTESSTQQGGNLAIASGMMLVAQPNRIAAYCEYSQLKERIERDLTKHQDDSSLLIQLADLEMTEGAAEAAETALKRVISAVDPDHPHYSSARQRLAKLWRDAGKVAFEHSQFSAAREKWSEALSVTDDPQKRLELIFSLAQTESEHPENAVTWLQSILDDDQLTSFPFGQITAGQEAARRISGLIAEHGPDAYAKAQSVASEELQRLKTNLNSIHLQRYLQRFPHAVEISTARQLLATSFRSEEKIPEAYAVLDRTRRNAADAREFVDATMQMIELLEQTNRPTAACDLWESLSGIDSTTETKVRGVNRSLKDALSEWRNLRTSIPVKRPTSFERNWTVPLMEGDLVIFPENDAPSEQMLSVLVCSRDKALSNRWTWQCLNWCDGSVRWESNTSVPIQTARWTPVHLMIGTAHGWQARDIEVGRIVWTNENPLSSTSTIAQFTLQTTKFGQRTAWPTLFEPDSGIQILDPNDGRTVSRIKPPGRMNPYFAVGDSISLGISIVPPTNEKLTRETFGERQTNQPLVALFQTKKPTRTWMATTTSVYAPWALQEISIETEPWSQAPLGIANRIVGLTAEQHLVSHLATSTATAGSVDAVSEPNSDDQLAVAEYLRNTLGEGNPLETGGQPGERMLLHKKLAKTILNPKRTTRNLPSTSWAFGNFPMGQALPFAWIQHEQLLVASDGLTLNAFNPQTGARNWTATLGSFPLDIPEIQFCTVGTTVYATSHGWLRGINVQNGKTLVERYIGQTAHQSQTTAIWTPQHNLKTSGTSADIGPHEKGAILAIWPFSDLNNNDSWIALVDGTDGEILQRIRPKHKPKKFLSDNLGSGILWDERSISGWITATN